MFSWLRSDRTVGTNYAVVLELDAIKEQQFKHITNYNNSAQCIRPGSLRGEAIQTPAPTKWQMTRSHSSSCEEFSGNLPAQEMTESPKTSV